MKRSEMIELIVYEALSWDGLSTSGVPVEEVANDMLRVCEKMGMRPPAQETYEISDMQGNNLGVLDDVYEWEPEDETK